MYDSLRYITEENPIKVEEIKTNQKNDDFESGKYINKVTTCVEKRKKIYGGQDKNTRDTHQQMKNKKNEKKSI